MRFAAVSSPSLVSSRQRQGLHAGKQTGTYSQSSGKLNLNLVPAEIKTVSFAVTMSGFVSVSSGCVRIILPLETHIHSSYCNVTQDSLVPAFAVTIETDNLSCCVATPPTNSSTRRPSLSTTVLQPPTFLIHCGMTSGSRAEGLEQQEDLAHCLRLEPDGLSQNG